MAMGPNAGWHLAGSEELRHSWGWFVVLGIILVIVGLLALSWSVLATITSVLIFGWMLVFGGVLTIVHAFLRLRWGGFFLELFTGILYAIIGLMVVGNPAASAVALTLVIAVLLLVGGIFRIVTALTVRFHHWVWMLLNGIISLVLGVLIWMQWPLSGLWVIGLFVGIDMLFYGWSLIMLGLMVRSVPGQPV